MFFEERKYFRIFRIRKLNLKNLRIFELFSFELNKFRIENYRIFRTFLPFRINRIVNFRIERISNESQFDSTPSLKKPEKLLILEPKLKILRQNSSLIHVRTRQFET